MPGGAQVERVLMRVGVLYFVKLFLLILRLT